MPDTSTYDEEGRPTVPYNSTPIYENRLDQGHVVQTAPLMADDTSNYQSAQLSRSSGPSPLYNAILHSPSNLGRDEDVMQDNNSGDHGSGDEDVLASEPM